MKSINVLLNDISYPIWIKINLIDRLPNLLSPLNNGQSWFLFTNEKLFLKYGKKLVNNLSSQNFKVNYILINDNEDAKSLKNLETIFSKIIKNKYDRSSVFISLGGGVISDLIGFMAATFLRGIDYINIPTTLLSMVDSSIGGKTGINLIEGKNLVGAYWHPKAVIVDPNLLNTLPKREFVSAIGEIIKYGAIFDKKFLVFISNNIDNIINLKSKKLIEKIITCCVKYKVKIVVDDERESDKRRILNFGHTVGHALELYCGLDKLRHGEAVAYGMIVAAKLSMKYAKLKLNEYNLLTSIIKKLPLPQLKNINSSDVLNIMRRDKKNKKGVFNFILLNSLGSPKIINIIDDNKLIDCIDSISY